MGKKREFKPPGYEFEAMCKKLQKVASDRNLRFDQVRWAKYTYWDTRLSQWTIREVIEIFDHSIWKELNLHEQTKPI